MESKKLTLKNYTGYAITDFGNNAAFSVISAYLTLFYTDVIGKNFTGSIASSWLVATTVLMIVARVWDGINDPIMGFIVQKAKPTKHGKFRHYILIGGIPLAVVACLCFLPLENLSLAGAIAFATITYIAYGMLYTVVLVPYGSLATVMTRDEKERSRLSIMRSIGGGISGAVAGFAVNAFAYTKVDGVSSLDGTKLVIIMAIIGVLMIVAYLLGFLFTKENYPYPNTADKTSIGKTLKTLIHNKPFVIMSLAGMLLIASSMYIQTIDIYIMKDFYSPMFPNLPLQVLTIGVSVATYAPMVIMILFTEKIIKVIGKKEMCMYGLILSTVASLVMWLWKIPNPWIFLAFAFLQGAGVGFFTLEVWAMAMDVIDYQELLSHHREEATSYAIFTFMRKIGQAIAALIPALLAIVGYDTELVGKGQAEETVAGMYNIGTMVPFIMFALMLILMILYPLNKKNDKKMREDLAALRATYENEIAEVAEEPENNDSANEQTEEVVEETKSENIEE